MWLTAVRTPGPYIAPWGVYAPSNVTGPISWGADGAPTADAALTPAVEVWNNASTAQAFSVALTVFNAAGAAVATSSGSGTVPAGGAVTWSPPSPVALPGAALWHLVAPPLKPALYTLTTTLTVGGVAVDATNVTFGVRATWWDAATGFYLNGKATKILGNANVSGGAPAGGCIRLFQRTVCDQFEQRFPSAPPPPYVRVTASPPNLRLRLTRSTKTSRASASPSPTTYSGTACPN